MSFFTLSPNMDLPIPIVGQEPGPTYATDINNCLTLLDRHDHTEGNGVPITPEAIDINSALNFQSNFAINVSGVTFDAQGSTPAINTIYQSGVDLFFVDGDGNDVRITQSGAVAGTPGSITNLVAPASAVYESSSQTFVWESAVNVPANMDMASAILRNLTLSSFSLTLEPPAAMGSDRTITLPELPASTSIMEISSSGTITATQPVTTLMPTGAVMAFAAASAPTGWLICDGSAVSRSTYAALYAVIGITAGEGNGTTTFNLPDLRGRFVRGVDGAAGRDPNSGTRTAMNTGGNTGNNVNSVQDDAFESHLHGITDPGHQHTQSVCVVGGGDLISPGNFGDGSQTATVTETGFASINITQTNNTGGSETRPINAYMTYIIKI